MKKALFSLAMLCVSTFSFASTNITSTQEDTAQRIFKNSFNQHIYVSDQEQYKEKEKWVASLKGDCEDFALYVRKQFLQEHIDSELWIVRTETGELHVVLRLVIENWDVVADNRYNRLVDKDVLDYKWISKVSNTALEKY